MVTTSCARRIFASILLALLGSLMMLSCDVARSTSAPDEVEFVHSSVSSNDGLAVFSVLVQSCGDGGSPVVISSRAFLNEDGLLSMSQAIRPAYEISESTITLKGGGHRAEASLSGITSWGLVSDAAQIEWNVQ